MWMHSLFFLVLMYHLSGNNPRKVILRALDRVRGRELGLLDSASPKSQPTMQVNVVSQLPLYVLAPGLVMIGHPSGLPRKYAGDATVTAVVASSTTELRYGAYKQTLSLPQMRTGTVWPRAAPALSALIK